MQPSLSLFEHGPRESMTYGHKEGRLISCSAGDPVQDPGQEAEAGPNDLHHPAEYSRGLLSGLALTTDK